MNEVSEIGNKVGLSSLSVRVLDAIMVPAPLPTNEVLATKFSCQPHEIQDIIYDPLFQQAYHRVVLGKHYYRLDDMIKKTTEQGLEGSVAHQKLYYQLLGLIDAKGIKHITANQFNLGQSPEEVVAKRKELEEILKEDIRREDQERHRPEIPFGVAS